MGGRENDTWSIWGGIGCVVQPFCTSILIRASTSNPQALQQLWNKQYQTMLSPMLLWRARQKTVSNSSLRAKTIFINFRINSFRVVDKKSLHLDTYADPVTSHLMA